MTGFMINFLICNIILAAITGIILAMKRLFKKCLTNRMQYNIWFPFLILLTVPFLPIRLTGFRAIISRIISLAKNIDTSISEHSAEAVQITTAEATGNIHDFAVSISQITPSFIGTFLTVIWLTGMGFMILCMIKSLVHLRRMKNFPLPLQNQNVRILYKNCLNELQIHKEIPLYCIAAWKSPVLIGALKPCIYLPLHLVTDFSPGQEESIRYMLLHELQHYKHRDNFVNILMNLISIFYWFNPFIWIALKNMRNDREVACDSSVLQMLNEKEYLNYGNTLLNCAEKISHMPFSFTTGISGSMKQMKRRILNIASYEKTSAKIKTRSLTVFFMITLFLFTFTPVLSTYASNDAYYQEEIDASTIVHMNLSEYFKNMEGSFVLYESDSDTWNIYNETLARTRVSPASTYKIYDALFALEEGMITPEYSILPWNGTTQPFKAWEGEQNLDSALQNSVNWYFQMLDSQMGIPTIRKYLKEIDYGNETARNNTATYWGDGTLTISPIEQVALLKKLYLNEFQFDPQNINAVKQALHLSSENTNFSEEQLYGKTGTAQINGQNVRGWFIGFAETSENICYFATYIQGEPHVTGTQAAEITKNILSDLNILK